jgi:hypothetical protein
LIVNTLTVCPVLFDFLVIRLNQKIIEMENKNFRLIKDAYIQLRLNSSIKAAIKELVEENNSTLSAFVEKALISELKREGKTVTVKIEETIV